MNGWNDRDRHEVAVYVEPRLQVRFELMWRSQSDRDLFVAKYTGAHRIIRLPSRPGDVEVTMYEPAYCLLDSRAQPVNRETTVVLVLEPHPDEAENDALRLAMMNAMVRQI